MNREDTGAILVTGGAGYIGGHTALALAERGERVVVLDDLSAGEPAFPVSGEFVRGDVGDSDLVRETIKKHGIDTVLHFAGFIRVDESVREPEKYFNNNTEKTRILMQTAAACGVKHAIFSSSAAVYGNPEHVPISEDAPLSPINPYGASKAQAEPFVRDSGMKSVILRYFNVAGTDPRGKAGYRIEEHPTHLIRTALRALIKGAAFNVNGRDYPTPDGTCIRDYIHVSDLADAHVAALEHLREGGASRTYNCGYGHGYSILEVINALMRATGRTLTVEYGARREGDPAALVADVSRIKKELSWKPKHDDIESIIRNEYEWVKARVKA